jgi:transcriptional regulator with XRE-family HTH domain
VGLEDSTHPTQVEALAAKSRIAKPNLSRLENDKVTTTFDTLRTIAAALDTHPALLVSAKKSEHAWTWTRHEFTEWKLGLLWKESARGSAVQMVSMAELVDVFLATRPEHRYARRRMNGVYAPNRPEFFVEEEEWLREARIVKTV